jgi:hypothetical protein
MQERISLEKAKTILTKESMDLNVQKEISFASLQTDLHKHANPQVLTPPVEPAGRAPDGQAFAR